MRTELFDYDLPPELIAQHPKPRGESRLLVLHRESGRIEHRAFSDMGDYLQAGDTLVLNDTRVTARRLLGLRENGLPAEVLLLRPVGNRAWAALVKPGKSLRIGKTLTLPDPIGGKPLLATVAETTPEGGRVLAFADTEARDRIAVWGETPLPPYIHAKLGKNEEERYQTVYAREGGSAAAPTAGLHFTDAQLKKIQAQGVSLAFLTLHVGVGTFRPVRAEEIEAHEMHKETYHLSQNAAEVINSTRGRVFAVGTTSVRTLESVALQNEEAGKRVLSTAGETQIFITPGFPFRATDALITNFHLPKSTLLMLVSAFANREQVMEAYAQAIAERYRFFSFGDAMLIL